MTLNSALSRFIKQGLRRGVCPLCRVAYKLDGEYMWAFFDEYWGDGSTQTALRRSRGFCSEHAGRLRRLEVEGLHSNLGISGVYTDIFEGLAEQLEGIGPGSQLPVRQPCPACAYRDQQVERNARYLLDEVSENGRSRQLFERSDGLCFPHFELVWEHAETEAERALVAEVQRRSVARLIGQLRANVLKQGHEYPGQPDTEEAGSWKRAIHLTVGYSKEALRDPPPDEEHRYQLPAYARIDTEAERRKAERPEDQGGLGE